MAGRDAAQLERRIKELRSELRAWLGEHPADCWTNAESQQFDGMAATVIQVDRRTQKGGGPFVCVPMR